MVTTQHVIEVGEDDFQEKVLDRSEDLPVVVDFWAEWCGPCRVLGPTLERLAADAGGDWILAKVDVDANPGLARRYGIQGIPAVKGFVDGEVKDQFTGALSGSQVESWLKRVVPDASDDLLKVALQAKADGDLQEAERAMTEAIERRPANAKARIEMAKLLRDAGRPDEALEHLDTIGDHAPVPVRRQRDLLRIRIAGAGLDVDALQQQIADDPDDLEQRWSLAQAQAADGHYDDALGNLLEIVRRDRNFRDDGARKQMLRLFEVIGPRSPGADKWRDELSKVLF